MRTPPSPTIADYHDSFRSRTIAPPRAAAELTGMTRSHAGEPLSVETPSLEPQTPAGLDAPFLQAPHNPTRDLAERNGAAEAGVCAVQQNHGREVEEQ